MAFHGKSSLPNSNPRTIKLLPVFPGTVQLTSGGKLLIPWCGNAQVHRRLSSIFNWTDHSACPFWHKKSPGQEIKFQLKITKNWVNCGTMTNEISLPTVCKELCDYFRICEKNPYKPFLANRLFSSDWRQSLPKTRRFLDYRNHGCAHGDISHAFSALPIGRRIRMLCSYWSKLCDYVFDVVIIYNRLER